MHCVSRITSVGHGRLGVTITQRASDVNGHKCDTKNICSQDRYSPPSSCTLPDPYETRGDYAVILDVLTYEVLYDSYTAEVIRRFLCWLTSDLRRHAKRPVLSIHLANRLSWQPSYLPYLLSLTWPAEKVSIAKEWVQLSLSPMIVAHGGVTWHGFSKLSFYFLGVPHYRPFTYLFLCNSWFELHRESYGDHSA